MTTVTEFYREVGVRQDELPCRAEDATANDWFAEPGSVKAQRAKTACMDCPLFWQCQSFAIEQGIPNGVWGGLDERQREHIWRNMPGGKPSHFIDSMDAMLGPLLQERRDFENFDANHSDPYTEDDDAA
jgi:hypothetical protein